MSEQPIEGLPDGNPLKKLTSLEMEEAVKMLTSYMEEHVKKNAEPRAILTLVNLRNQGALNMESVVTVNYRIGFKVGDLVEMAWRIHKK